LVYVVIMACTLKSVHSPIGETEISPALLWVAWSHRGVVIRMKKNKKCMFFFGIL